MYLIIKSLDVQTDGNTGHPQLGITAEKVRSYVVNEDGEEDEEEEKYN